MTLQANNNNYRFPPSCLVSFIWLTFKLNSLRSKNEIREEKGGVATNNSSILSTRGLEKYVFVIQMYLRYFRGLVPEKLPWLFAFFTPHHFHFKPLPCLLNSCCQLSANTFYLLLLHCPTACYFSFHVCELLLPHHLC